MLGYDKEDLDIMIASCADGAFYLPPSRQRIAMGLTTTISFLQGLLAEGYFNES